MKMPVNAMHLVKVDMPEFDIDPNQPRELEINEDPSDPDGGWARYRIEKFSVNSSVHVSKKAADQFEVRTHKRLLDIVDPTARTVDELKKLNLPAGVDIQIHI